MITEQDLYYCDVISNTTQLMLQVINRSIDESLLNTAQLTVRLDDHQNLVKSVVEPVI